MADCDWLVAGGWLEWAAQPQWQWLADCHCHAQWQPHRSHCHSCHCWVLADCLLFVIAGAPTSAAHVYVHCSTCRTRVADAGSDIHLCPVPGDPARAGERADERYTVYL